MNKPVYLGLSMLEISKFWYHYINSKYQNNAKLCYMDQVVLLFILKLKMFMKTFPMMLKKDLIHEIMKSIDHCLQERIKQWLD